MEARCLEQNKSKDVVSRMKAEIWVGLLQLIFLGVRVDAMFDRTAKFRFRFERIQQRREMRREFRNPFDNNMSNL